MPINTDSQIPTYCKNCTHRFVCSIQSNIQEQDTDVTVFNTDHAGSKQSIASVSYVCRYKANDTTV